MAWETELLPIARVMIDDMGATPKYSDDRLKQTLLVAARLVANDVDLSCEININLLSISPDPTEDPRDEWFVNAICVRAACLISQGGALKSAGQAIRIKDGASEIDLSKTAGAWAEIMNNGWCAVYRELLVDYKSGQRSSGIFGAAVMGPIRLYATGGGSHYRRF